MISLGLINKNDSKNLVRLIEEMRPYVKEIVVVDTGSTDNSIALAKSAGADTILNAADLVDVDGILTSFGAARQRGLDACHQPWFMWLDTDDALVGRELLPEKIELLESTRNILENRGKALSYSMTYEYSWNKDRSVCIQQFQRERIVYRADGWKWRRPVHEFLSTSMPVTQMHALGLKVVHLSQGARGCENDRNLRILEKWLIDGGEADEPATLYYYLADEHLVRGNYAKSAEFFSKCLASDQKFPWQERALFRLLDSLYLDSQFKKVLDIAQECGSSSIAQNAHIGYQVGRAAIALNYPNEIVYDTFMKASKLNPISFESPEIMDIIQQCVFSYGQKIKRESDV